MSKLSSIHHIPGLVALCLCLYSKLVLAECIGVVTAGAGVDFWQHIERGALSAGEELNYKVIVRGPKNEADTKSQYLIVQQMIDMGCGALVIAPNAQDRTVQVETLSKQGIPTVFIDRDFGGSRVAVVKTENFNAGVIAAREMLRRTAKGAKIAILRLNQDVQSTDDRERGFITEMNKANANIVIDQYLGVDFAEASMKAYKILINHQEIEGIFTPNELTTLALLNMRQRVPNGADIIHIGFDAHPSFLKHIEDGFLAAVVIQSPFNMGYQGVQAAYSALQNKNPAPLITTPVLVVSTNNLNSQEVAQTLAGRQ